MKTRIVITNVILIFAVLIFIGNYAIGEDEYVPAENEEIYGTWVNPSYRTGVGELYWAWFAQKMIYKPGGTLEAYDAVADIGHFSAEYKIIDKWSDSEGNTYYKLYTKWGDKTYGQKTVYELHKVSNSGLTLEYINTYDEYPTEFDTDHPQYHIYNRK